MSDDTSMLSHVIAGAKYLDETSPGWALRIDLPTLDLSDGQSCVIGQLDGSYFDGLGKRELSDDEAYAYGFNTLPAAEFYDAAYLVSEDDWQYLTELWSGVIIARLEEKTA